MGVRRYGLSLFKYEVEHGKRYSISTGNHVLYVLSLSTV